MLICPDWTVPKFSRIREVQADIALSYTCPITNKTVTATHINVRHEGGCVGHHEGEYCYCPDNEFIADWECPECKGQHKARLY